MKCHKFTGKHLCQSLFLNKVTGLRPATLLKKSLWHKCFPVNFAKFLRTPFLLNTCEFVLIKIFIVFQELTLQMLFLVFLKTVMTILWKSEIFYCYGYCILKTRRSVCGNKIYTTRILNDDDHHSNYWQPKLSNILDFTYMFVILNRNLFVLTGSLPQGFQKQDLLSV